MKRIASIAANASSVPTSAWEGRGGLSCIWRIVRQQNSSRKAAFAYYFLKEDLHKVIEATLAFFEEHGKPGERFGNTLDRVGWDLLKNRLEEVLKAG